MTSWFRRLISRSPSVERPMQPLYEMPFAQRVAVCDHDWHDSKGATFLCERCGESISQEYCPKCRAYTTYCPCGYYTGTTGWPLSRLIGRREKLLREQVEP